jgi:hypothetical protein
MLDPARTQGPPDKALEAAAVLVEQCTDVLSESTARKLASRIRALGEPEMRLAGRLEKPAW